MKGWEETKKNLNCYPMKFHNEVKVYELIKVYTKTIIKD